MRKNYIDLLRMIALFYMFFEHSVLGVLNINANDGIIYFLFELVPICPALFLFLSGLSFSISFERNGLVNKKEFIFHQLRRTILLLFSAQLLFFIEYGFQLPDLFLSNGILNTIGIMIAISLIFVYAPLGEIFLSIFICLLIFFSYYFEVKNIFVFPFNNGYEPISPTIIFGFIGLLIGMKLNKIKDTENYKKIFIGVLGFIGIFIFIFFQIKYSGFNVYFTEFGRYTITRNFNEACLIGNIIKNGDYHLFSASVWNYNFECFIASVGAVFILFSAAYFSEGFFKKYLPEMVFMPGKYSLFNYFFHLSVIGIIIMMIGENKLDTVQFVLFLSVLFLLSYIISFLFSMRKKIFR